MQEFLHRYGLLYNSADKMVKVSAAVNTFFNFFLHGADLGSTTVPIVPCGRAVASPPNRG
jgi:hypothetical protein